MSFPSRLVCAKLATSLRFYNVGFVPIGIRLIPSSSMCLKKHLARDSPAVFPAP